ncbi:DNA repair protein rad5 [Hondaea fermentalgiana]|uniref:DNA repair protein rad5 n=1 Tax=Hondaea fermentalgiana TaxID=2315210 RepID=A0A2R5GH79_9STRA|nr:DNA repair protein rad5 [Hondaea fermentalgiana]|eukprot:GBG30252.1 DNA repair protein rad5 [Hondaea fermentalgiana]
MDNAPPRRRSTRQSAARCAAKEKEKETAAKEAKAKAEAGPKGKAKKTPRNKAGGNAAGASANVKQEDEYDVWHTRYTVSYDKIGSKVPETISFFTGKPAQLPQDWAQGCGGDRAAQYSHICSQGLRGYDPAKSLAKNELRPYFDAFRRVGYIDMRLKGRDSFVKNWLMYTPSGPHKSYTLATMTGNKETPKAILQRLLWRHDTGEPAAVESPVSMAKLRKAVYGGKVQVKHEAHDGTEYSPEELLEWIDMVTTYQHPRVSPWRTPFVRCVSQIEQRSKTEVRARFHLYVNRLLFYMIADEGLRVLFRILRPSGGIVAPLSKQWTGEPVFRKSLDGASTRQGDQFTVTSLLGSHESVGYAQYKASPPGLALEMRDYQLQTLQWMVDQERLPRGLNGCFWEERAWTPTLQEEAEEAVTTGRKASSRQKGTKVEAKAETESTESNMEESFFFSSELGELRLQKPPLVRGGLVCEEMGLGKTLEFIALILHDRVSPEVDYAPREDLYASQASLFVVPDALLPQWAEELEKSPDDVAEDIIFSNVMTRRRGPDTEKAAQDLAACDIVLATYRSVQQCSLLINMVHWRRVCLDEMQEIRSSTTVLASKCRSITARARWMISGTPVYTGIDDIHGELNFLGVIPFCLPDNSDGFWGRCVKTPYEARDEKSLSRLGLLLSHIMMRHSKKQTYIANPSKTILELPVATMRFVGVPLASPERALYRYIEVLVNRAVGLMEVRNQRRSMRNAQSRPWAVGAELLRTFASSPQLVSGGNGAPQQLSNLNTFVRDLLQTLRARDVLRNREESRVISDIFSGFPALPGDELRDLLLSAEAAVASKSSSSRGGRGGASGASAMVSSLNRQQYAATAGAGAGAAAGAVREHILERLNETKDKLETAIRGSSEALCSAKGGSLPRLRWRWAVQAITSGKYLAMRMMQSRNDENVRVEVLAYGQKRAVSGILFRRAARVMRCVKRLEEAQAEVDAAFRRYEQMSSEQLCSELASLSSEFHYEIVIDQETSLMDFGRQRERTTIKLQFPGRETSVKLTDDPVGIRRRLIDSILPLHHGHRCLERVVQVLRADFDETCSPGIGLTLPILPVALTLQGARFEARFAAGGKRAFYLVSKLLAVDESAGAIKVRFLDGEERLLAASDVRYVSPYAAPDKANVEAEEEKTEIARLTLLDVCKRVGLNRESLDRIAAEESLAQTSLMSIHGINLDKLQKLMVDSDREALAARRLERVLDGAHADIVARLFNAPLKRDPSLRTRVREWYCSKSASERRVDDLIVLVGVDSEIERAALRAALSHHFGVSSALLDAPYASFSVQFGLKGDALSSASSSAATGGSTAAGSIGDDGEMRPAFELAGKAQLMARVASMSPTRTSNRPTEYQISKVLHVDDRVRAARVRLEDDSVREIPWSEIIVSSSVSSAIISDDRKTKMIANGVKHAGKRRRREVEDAAESASEDENAVQEEESDLGSRASSKKRRTGPASRGGHRLAFQATRGSAVIYADEIVRVDFDEGEITVRRADTGLVEVFDWAHMLVDHEWHGAVKNMHEAVSEKFSRIAVLEATIAEQSKLAQDLRTYANTLQAAYERGASRVDTLERQGLMALQELIDKTNVPECGICLDKMERPTCTMCIHLFCEGCIEQHIKATEGRMWHMLRNEARRFPCPLCRRKLTYNEIYRVLEPSSKMDALGVASASGDVDNENAETKDCEVEAGKKEESKDKGKTSRVTRKVTRSMRRGNEAVEDENGDDEDAGEGGEREEDGGAMDTSPNDNEVVESIGLPSAARWSACPDAEETSRELARFALSEAATQSVVSRVGLEALSTNFINLLAAVTGFQGHANPSEQNREKRGSKMARVVSDLKRFATQEGKTVVFSQQRHTVLHLSSVLQQEEVLHARIVKGDRVPVLRTALEAFLKNDAVRVLVLQSSSAAAGLTLTIATRVLLFEPFLKQGEEQQAINRVHRIGQTRPVETICYFTRGTVEDRVLAWRMERNRVTVQDAEDELLVDPDEAGVSGGVSNQERALGSRRYLRFITGMSEAATSTEEEDEENRRVDGDHDVAADRDQEDEDEANEDSDLDSLDSSESDLSIARQRPQSSNGVRSRESSVVEMLWDSSSEDDYDHDVFNPF